MSTIANHNPIHQPKNYSEASSHVSILEHPRGVEIKNGDYRREDTNVFQSPTRYGYYMTGHPSNSDTFYPPLLDTNQAVDASGGLPIINVQNAQLNEESHIARGRPTDAIDQLRLQPPRDPSRERRKSLHLQSFPEAPEVSPLSFKRREPEGSHGHSGYYLNDVINQHKLPATVHPDKTIEVHKSIGSGNVRQVSITERIWHRRKQIGRGGFSEVWLEENLENGEMRAIKILKKHNRLDYKRELHAHTILKDEPLCFVKYLGWFEDHDNIYLAMEYFEHGDLAAYMQSGADISEKEVAYICYQILQGLQYMFMQNFSHRDIKPKNIFVRSKPPQDLWVKLGDFGLMKRTLGDTRLNTVAYSENYTAPEIFGFYSPEKFNEARPGSPFQYTNSVDIWSIGVIAFEILAKVVPFPSQGSLSSYCNGSQSFPKDKLEGRARLNGISFLERALAPDPTKRPSVEECLEDPWIKWGAELAPKQQDKKSDRSRPTSHVKGTSPEITQLHHEFAEGMATAHNNTTFVAALEKSYIEVQRSNNANSYRHSARIPSPRDFIRPDGADSFHHPVSNESPRGSWKEESPTVIRIMRTGSDLTGTYHPTNDQYLNKDIWTGSKLNLSFRTPKIGPRATYQPRGPSISPRSPTGEPLNHPQFTRAQTFPTASSTPPSVSEGARQVHNNLYGNFQVPRRLPPYPTDTIAIHHARPSPRNGFDAQSYLSEFIPRGLHMPYYDDVHDADSIVLQPSGDDFSDEEDLSQLELWQGAPPHGQWSSHHLHQQSSL